MGSGRGGLGAALRRRLGRGQVEDEGPDEVAAEAEELITNPWDFYPELQPLRQTAKAKDWRAVRARLAEIDDPGDRARIGSLLTTSLGIEEMLTAAVEENPEDTDALALLAGRTLVLGWEIRGGGYGSTVSEAQAEAFHEHVERADAMLLDVTARDPANIDAGVGRIIAARALSMGGNEVERRYRQLAEHHPHVLTAQFQALQGLLPKWGGEWKGALFFAVECARAAPPGSPNAALIADYHLEKWLSLPSEDKWNYIQGHAVRVELVAAAERSVLHRDYRPGLNWVETHNLFAKALAFADEDKKAALLFDRLEGRMSGVWTSPTSYVKFRRLTSEAAAEA
ncbi:MAG TPA: hypothetical protein VE081_14775 [Sporichthyaceae bacterium]|nr:hypothetical protein [Sporichthyaceae bacterium]